MKIFVTVFLVFLMASVIYCSTYMVRVHKRPMWVWILISLPVMVELVSFLIMLYWKWFKIFYHVANIYVFIATLALWMIPLIFTLDKVETPKDKEETDKKAWISGLFLVIDWIKNLSWQNERFVYKIYRKNNKIKKIDCLCIAHFFATKLRYLESYSFHQSSTVATAT